MGVDKSELSSQNGSSVDFNFEHEFDLVNSLSGFSLSRRPQYPKRKPSPSRIVRTQLRTLPNS